jgi:hypothetical protein
MIWTKQKLELLQDLDHIFESLHCVIIDYLSWNSLASIVTRLQGDQGSKPKEARYYYYYYYPGHAVVNQSINLLLDYIIRLCPLDPRFYGAQTNTCPLKTTAYSCLHTTNISFSSTSIINVI